MLEELLNDSFAVVTVRSVVLLADKRDGFKGGGGMIIYLFTFARA